MSHLILRRLPARTLPSLLAHHRTLTTTPRLLAWKGSSGEDHITNSKDELDVHSAGAKAGKRDRAQDDKQSSAASERDSRQDNKRAKEDHPEAPGPVIGMNDERGGVGFLLLALTGFLVIGTLVGVLYEADMSVPGNRRDIEGDEQCGHRQGERGPRLGWPIDFRRLQGGAGSWKGFQAGRRIGLEWEHAEGWDLVG